MRPRALVVLVLGCVALAAPALAQYARAPDEECTIIESESTGEETTTLRVDELFTVSSAPSNPALQRCADPGETVDFEGLSTPVLLGRTRADALGNYTSPALRFPRGTAPGAHSVVVRTRLGGEEVAYTRAITLVGARGLPVTGRDIALLGAWGVLMVGFGTVLVQATRGARAEARRAGRAAERRPRTEDWVPLLVDVADGAWADGVCADGASADGVCADGGADGASADGVCADGAWAARARPDGAWADAHAHDPGEPAPGGALRWPGADAHRLARYRAEPPAPAPDQARGDSPPFQPDQARGDSPPFQPQPRPPFRFARPPADPGAAQLLAKLREELGAWQGPDSRLSSDA